jgi:hypothetical protein
MTDRPTRNSQRFFGRVASKERGVKLKLRTHELNTGNQV